MSYAGHNSAFQAIFTQLHKPSILLDGIGNVSRYNNSLTNYAKDLKETYSITFERSKRYLLRLINTSFESTFVFFIDNHMLTVVDSDFVPIYSYQNTSVLVGIGQRYHIIVEANP